MRRLLSCHCSDRKSATSFISANVLNQNREAPAPRRRVCDWRDASIIVSIRSCRVGEDVATLTPHRPGRADFPHPVLHERGLLTAAYPWRILTEGSGWWARS